ncbi:MAG: hypothetical protein KY443_00550 [Actinobacteria bacterium]|nr:hypothetical protein [Actinomycetota bacterium]
MRLPRLLVAFLTPALVCLTGLTAPAPARAAAQSGEFSLRPVRPADAPARERSYIVRTVDVGSVFTDRLEAVNLTDEPLELDVAAVDATVLDDGSFAPGTAAAAEGAWITVTPSRVRVPAKGTAPVQVRITVPADAALGDHIAAVVAQRADGGTTPSGQPNVVLRQRVGVRVYLTVRGDEPLQRAFEVRDLRWVGAPSARAFEVDIANVGGLLVEPVGTLTIERGGLSATTELPVLGTVPVGESRTLRFSAGDTELEPGAYEATLTLRDINGGPEHQRTVSFTVEGAAELAGRASSDSSFPSWLGVVAGGALAGVVFALYRRRRNEAGADAQPPAA